MPKNIFTIIFISFSFLGCKSVQSQKIESQTQSIIPQLLPIYFSHEKMSKCLTNKLVEKNQEIKNLISFNKVINERRNKFASKNFMTEENLPWYKEKLSIFVAKRLIYHSCVLADYHESSSIEWNEKTNYIDVSQEFNEADSEFSSFLSFIENRSNKTRNENIVDSLQLSDEWVTFTQQYEKVQNIKINKNKDLCLKSASISSSKIFKWLLQQKKFSITHWELIQQALRYNNDNIYNALSDIGHLFDSERIVCSRIAGGRNRTCFLGTRMLPLLGEKSSDPVGYNYHFWAYLNLAITGKSTFEKLFNYGFQEILEDDHGDYSANYFGIQIGKEALKNAQNHLSQGTKKAPYLNIDCEEF